MANISDFVSRGRTVNVERQEWQRAWKTNRWPIGARNEPATFRPQPGRRSGTTVQYSRLSRLSYCWQVTYLPIYYSEKFKLLRRALSLAAGGRIFHLSHPRGYASRRQAGPGGHSFLYFHYKPGLYSRLTNYQPRRIAVGIDWPKTNKIVCSQQVKKRNILMKMARDIINANFILVFDIISIIITHP